MARSSKAKGGKGRKGAPKKIRAQGGIKGVRMKGVRGSGMARNNYAISGKGIPKGTIGTTGGGP